MAERIRVVIEGVDEASKVLAGVSKEADKLGVSLKQIGAGLALTGAAIAGVLGLAVKAAAEQEQATATLAAAMQNLGTFTQEAIDRQAAFAAELQNTTVFADEQITRMQALLVQFGRLSGPELEQATKATIGFAAVLGVDLETAARRVALAVDGVGDGLGRFGVELDKDATRQERFQTIMEKGIGLFSIAEAQANTFTGALKQFKNQVNELGEAIGKVLLPTLTAMLKDFTALIKRVNEFATQHPQLTAGMVQLAVALAAISLILAPVVASWTTLVRLAKLLVPVILAVAAELAPLAVALGLVLVALEHVSGGTITWTRLLDALLATIKIVAIGIATLLLKITEAALFIAEKVPLAFGPLGAALIPFREQIKALREEVDQLAKGSLVALGEAAAQLQGSFAGGAAGPVTGLFAAPEGAAPAAPGVGPLAPPDVSAFQAAISEIQRTYDELTVHTQATMTIAQQAVAGLGDGINAFLTSTRTKWGESFGTMRNFVTNATTTMANAVSTGLGTAINNIIQGTKSASEAFKEFGQQLIRTIIEFVVEYAAQLLVAKALSLIFTHFITATANSIAAAWLPAAVLATIATLGGAAAQAPFAIAGALGATAGALSAIAASAGAGAKGGTTLQHGGIVTQPTFALIGEAGPEAVIPLDRAGGFGPRELNVSIRIDKAELTTPENVDLFVEQLAGRIGRLIEIRSMMPAGVAI